MEKGDHNLLIWQDPSADLMKYHAVNMTNFVGRLLPVQNSYSYDPFITAFNQNFQNSLSLPKGDSENALRIEGAVVECNPGSRAARYIVGFGAGKAAGGIVL